MTIQPYFPEPEVVPGNIASARYDDRLAFIRKTSLRYFITVAIVALIGWQAPTFQYPSFLFITGAVLLLALSLVRKVATGTIVDRLTAAVLFPVFLVVLGLLLRHIPLWPGFIMAFGAAALYTALCGRDYSFTGLFILAASTATVGHLVLFLYHWPYALISWATSVGLLFYYSYDLASLLQRRRAGEEWLATVDLYRDSLNFISYGFRVIHHWRSFRI